MTTRNPNRYALDITSHPGETLREVLAERGIVHRQFAKKLGIAPSYLCDFLQCRRGAAPRMALRLEKALGVSAEFWLTLQMHHDLAIERKRRKGAK